ncbi:MAG: hypothetical protein HY556_01755 [Euryarchaeota archaeon]|nr:hypothetical protein [Euryarchaeota archaeon]
MVLPVAAILSVTVWRAAPWRLQNRLLALLVFLEGAAVGSAYGFRMSTDVPEHAFAFNVVGLAAGFALLPIYLLFLSTLSSSLARPLAVWHVRPVLAASAAIAPLVPILAPSLFLGGLTPGTLNPWVGIVGPYYFHFFGILVLTMVYGLGVAYAAYVEAPPESASKARAKAYVVAFGTRDVFYAALATAQLWLPRLGDTRYVVVNTGFPVVTLLFLALLSYGILRTQLFDVNLRIKWGISRGTVAAAFVVVFVVGTKLAESFLETQFDWLAGGLLAGLMLLGLAPLQRAADRVAEAAMPGVKNTGDYVAYRKLLVYRGAVEAAMEDGLITEKERAVFARLRRDLQIGESDAKNIESEVAAQSKPGVPGA